MSDQPTRLTTPKAAQTVAVLSSITFFVSGLAFCLALYLSPRQPDQIHIYRVFTEHHMAHYLTEAQYVVIETSRYVFWASMVIMIAAGVIHRRLKAGRTVPR